MQPLLPLIQSRRIGWLIGGDTLGICNNAALSQTPNILYAIHLRQSQLGIGLLYYVQAL